MGVVVEGCLEVTLGSPPACPVILFSPQGRVFDQALARDLARAPQLALVCGRYEGVDQRAIDLLVTDEISLGDFVLTGGELPALLMIDALTRLLPGVLGDPTATDDDSHSMSKLLEYPHYTRPAQYRGQGIPPALLSGNHAAIDRWRRQQSLRRTLQRRPDLFMQAHLSLKDWELLLQDD
jgi:tRNA (guanine37-N1)-methyltransferase